MSEVTIPEKFADELKAIREDLDYIKEHMIDVDMILTNEEVARLKESLEEYKDGKAIPLEDFEKEIGK